MPVGIDQTKQSRTHVRMAVNRATLTVDEAAQVLGIGRNTAYEAVRRGEIPAIRFGRRYVVPRVGLELLVGPLPDEPTGGGPAWAGQVHEDDAEDDDASESVYAGQTRGGHLMPVGSRPGAEFEDKVPIPLVSRADAR